MIETVFIVEPEQWEEFKEYAEKCRIGTYQIKEVLDGKEVRVHAGRFGIVMVFDDLADKTQKDIYDEMLKFCAIQGFMQIQTSMNDEMFFA